MRYVVSLLTAVGIATLALVTPRTPVALAQFHCMRIHAVMAGFNGNGNIQYVELRMDTGGQTFVGGHILKFYSGDPAVAANLKATFTFPANVMTNGVTGDSILIATSEFNGTVLGGTADFVFAGNTVASNGGDAAHPVQGPSGLVHFAPGNNNCDPNPTIMPGEVDSVGYGTTPAYFGSSAPALPNPNTNGVLELNNLSQSPSNNGTEYGIHTVSASTFSVAPADIVSDLTTPRNNARTVLAFPQTAVGGISQDPQLTPPADATSSGSGRSWWWLYALGAAAFAATAASVAGWRLRSRATR